MITLKNEAEINKRLEKMAKAMTNEQVEPMIEASADIVLNALVAEVRKIPRVTGNLRRSPVKRRLSRGVHGGPRPFISAIDRKVAPHAHLVDRKHAFFRKALGKSSQSARDHLLNTLIDQVNKGASS